MLAFCTNCWQEMQAEQESCPHCGAKPDADARSFEEKLAAALKHPLAAVRARICWVMGRRRDAGCVASAEDDVRR